MVSAITSPTLGEEEEREPLIFRLLPNRGVREGPGSRGSREGAVRRATDAQLGFSRTRLGFRAKGKESAVFCTLVLCRDGDFH